MILILRHTEGHADKEKTDTHMNRHTDRQTDSVKRAKRNRDM